MLTSPTSLLFLVVCLIVEFIGIVALSRKRITDNNAMLFSYALVGSTGTGLNAAIGKLVWLNIGIPSRITPGILYVINAVVCLAVGALANGTLPDPSRYVPVSSGMNQLNTCIAGLVRHLCLFHCI